MDTTTQCPVNSKVYATRASANRAADRLNAEHGSYRYFATWVADAMLSFGGR